MGIKRNEEHYVNCSLREQCYKWREARFVVHVLARKLFPEYCAPEISIVPCIGRVTLQGGELSMHAILLNGKQIKICFCIVIWVFKISVLFIWDFLGSNAISNACCIAKRMSVYTRCCFS